MEQRIEKFKKLFKDMPEISDDDSHFFQYLVRSGYFTAPASAKYHGCEEGGNFDHSYDVTERLLWLTEKLNLKWERPQSPRIVGAFHDICKNNRYKSIYTKEFDDGVVSDSVVDHYEYADDVLFEGHGSTSVILLQNYLKLTEEEVACIFYHMGAYMGEDKWEELKRAIKKYPNVLWTHTADMVSSYIIGL